MATPVLEVTVAVCGAPGIWKTANTLPTRSTTAIVAGAPRALAWLTAWRTIVLTSLAVKFTEGEGVGVAAGCEGCDGAGAEAAEMSSLFPPPPPPPQLGAAAPRTIRTAIATWHKGRESRFLLNVEFIFGPSW